MNACEDPRCDAQFHDSTDAYGHPLHSHVWKVLGGGRNEVAAVWRVGDRGHVYIGLDSQGEYPADEVRGFADVEPAEYERALREAADLVDEINRSIH
jgi:hypothetical protein